MCAFRNQSLWNQRASESSSSLRSKAGGSTSGSAADGTPCTHHHAQQCEPQAVFRALSSCFLNMPRPADLQNAPGALRTGLPWRLNWYQLPSMSIVVCKDKPDNIVPWPPNPRPLPHPLNWIIAGLSCVDTMSRIWPVKACILWQTTHPFAAGPFVSSSAFLHPTSARYR